MYLIHLGYLEYEQKLKKAFVSREVYDSCFQLLVHFPQFCRECSSLIKQITYARFVHHQSLQSIGGLGFFLSISWY